MVAGEIFKTKLTFDWRSGSGSGGRRVVAGEILKQNYPLFGEAAVAVAVGGWLLERF